MKYNKEKFMKKTFAALMLAAVCMPGFGNTAFAEEKVYTLDGDFDEGLLINLNHDPKHDQLQLYDGDTKPFPFINVAASARGTVIRAKTETDSYGPEGTIMGEYKTAPEGRGLNPSRTSVDLRGNVWAGNRAVKEGDSDGSAVKIGIVVGGTRCDGRNADGTVTENSNGDYVWLDPDKLTYNTCVDRNGDGLIRTSKGLGDILLWSDNGDGAGGANGGDARVQDAEDECILIYQRLPDAPNTRHISVDISNDSNDVWVGGYPDEPRMFYKLDGETGSFVNSFDARTFGCGGYGGLVSDGILWSASLYDHALLRYDPVSRTGQCIEVLHSYGLSADNDGFIWNNMREIDSITKINPDTGDYAPGFPVLTGGDYSRGVVVTPKNNHAWSANSKSNTVTRLDSNGSLIAVIRQQGRTGGDTVYSGDQRC
jgi:streptogramin lyase